MENSGLAQTLARIASLQRSVESSVVLNDHQIAVRITSISRLVAEEDIAWLQSLQHRRVTHALLPVPVLAVSGAGSLELPWSQYLAHMLDPEASHGLGERLGKSLLDTFCEKNTGNYRGVVVEYDLGCACDLCSHHCSLDLLVQGERASIAIEHKVSSGPSNWRCADGHLHRQLTEYAILLEQRREPGVELVKLYLTPGRKESRFGAYSWRAVAHSELAQVFVEILPELRDSLQRYILASLVFDLNSGSLGRWWALVNDLEDLLKLDQSSSNASTLSAAELRLLGAIGQDSVLRKLLEELNRDQVS